MNEKPSLSIFLTVMGIIVTFGVLTGLLIFYAVKNIENNIDRKFDQLPIPVNITKYDSATEAKLEDISVSRAIQHRIVDDLHDGKLQSALDSVFNIQK